MPVRKKQAGNEPPARPRNQRSWPLKGEKKQRLTPLGRNRSLYKTQDGESLHKKGRVELGGGEIATSQKTRARPRRDPYSEHHVSFTEFRRRRCHRNPARKKKASKSPGGG